MSEWVAHEEATRQRTGTGDVDAGAVEPCPDRVRARPVSDYEEPPVLSLRSEAEPAVVPVLRPRAKVDPAPAVSVRPRSKAER